MFHISRKLLDIRIEFTIKAKRIEMSSIILIRPKFDRPL